MAKLLERRKAIELRRQGKSYSEIKQALSVSKSSLSLWLRNIPLNEKQLSRIKDKKEKAIERFRESMRLKREKRLKNYYEAQKTKWLPISKKEEFIAGLFLYWGEGNKSSRNSISINNTDPAVIKFSLYWLTRCLGVPKEKIKVQLHLYSDMDIEEGLNFWSKELALKKYQFSKPYIKKTNKIDIDQKGFGYGTCGIMVHDTVLKENILMAMKAFSDCFGEKAAKI